MNNEQATAPESNFYDSPNPYADFEMSGIKQQLKIGAFLIGELQLLVPREFVFRMISYAFLMGDIELEEKMNFPGREQEPEVEFPFF